MLSQEEWFQELQPSTQAQPVLLPFESKLCRAPIQIDSPVVRFLAMKSSVCRSVTDARWLLLWSLWQSNSAPNHVLRSWLKKKHSSPSSCHPGSHSETQLFSQFDPTTESICFSVMWASNNDFYLAKVLRKKEAGAGHSNVSFWVTISIFCHRNNVTHRCNKWDPYQQCSNFPTDAILGNATTLE